MPIGSFWAAVLASSAAWRARAEFHQLDADAMAAQVPADVCAALGLPTDKLLKDMPPLSELCEGLEALIS